MAAVNVAPDFFWTRSNEAVSAATIEACLKQRPRDFEVLEIPLEPSPSPLSSCTSIASARASVNMAPAATAAAAAAAPQAVPQINSEAGASASASTRDQEEDREVGSWLSSEQLEALRHLNAWLQRQKSVAAEAEQAQAQTEAVEIPLDGAESNDADLVERRRRLHRFVQRQFVYLGTSTEGLAKDQLVARPERSLVVAKELGLDWEDVEALYRFRAVGPTTNAAPLRLKAFELSKDQRAVLIQSLRALGPQWTIKTFVGTEAGEAAEEGACGQIEIGWSDKALRQARLREAKARHFKSLTAVAQPSRAEAEDLTRPIHLGFRLCKLNTEHLDAINQLAGILNVSPSEISFAGIKDKRALTYQRCTVTYRPSPVLDDSRAALTRNLSDCLIKPLAQLARPFRSSKKRKTSRGPSVGSLEGFEDGAGIEDAYICVDDIRICDKPLFVGQLWGNQFTIVLRQLRLRPLDVEQGETALSNKQAMQSLLDESLRRIQAQGFPNFFGSQRMGRSRESPLPTSASETGLTAEAPVGVLIGKALLSGPPRAVVEMAVLGDLRERVEARFASRPPDPSFEFMDWARQGYLEGRPLAEVIKRLPPSAARERALLYAVAKSATFVSARDDPACNWAQVDWARAVAEIPFHTAALWISSYQSWIWNRIVACRLQEQPTPVLGDLQEARDPKDLAVSGDSEALEVVGSQSKVTAISRPEDCETAELVQVVLPLFGSKVRFPRNATGQRYLELLREEGLLDVPLDTLRACFLKESGESAPGSDGPGVAIDPAWISSKISSFPKGAYRTLLQSVGSEASIEVFEEGAQLHAKLAFKLPAGSFATAFLRELLKNNEIV